MVIFNQRVYHLDANVFHGSTCRILAWRGVDINTFFPDHHHVDAEYRLLSPHNDVYYGTMSMYRSQTSSEPELVSSFIAWDCGRCRTMHHRFTSHEIYPDGVLETHCVWDFSHPEFYDADAGQTPYIITQEVSQGGHGLDRRPEEYTRQRFFFRHCHRCRTRHAHGMDQYWYGARSGNLQRRTCHDDPPDQGVAMAADLYERWRQTLRFPGGGPQVHGVQINDDAHDADVHGGQQQDQANADADDDRGGNQEQADDVEVNADAQRHNADDSHGGRQDQAPADAREDHMNADASSSGNDPIFSMDDVD